MFYLSNKSSICQNVQGKPQKIEVPKLLLTWKGRIGQFVCFCGWELTHMSPICSHSVNRSRSFKITRMPVTFPRFAHVSLTSRQFCRFWYMSRYILLIINVINLTISEARYGIFENHGIFPGVTSVQKVCRWNGLSLCYKNWCPKTEFGYLIGCQPGFSKIGSKWFRLSI